METRLVGSNVSIALLHYPVYDKNRSVVTTAVTNLDLHDIARAARTFGLCRYFVVTPLEEQKNLVLRIMSHWQDGWGASYNAKRKEAMDIMAVADSLENAVRNLEKEFNRPVKIVATCAKSRSSNVSFGEMADLLRDTAHHYMLLFGTGWGLTADVLDHADYVLEPIKGSGTYNHLSVRSAAAIVLDRLLNRS